MVQQTRSGTKKASPSTTASSRYHTVRVQDRTYLLLRGIQRYLTDETRKALVSGDVLTYFPLAQIIHLTASEYARIKGVKA